MKTIFATVVLALALASGAQAASVTNGDLAPWAQNAFESGIE